ncbi:WD40 repeat domain-containing protein [Deinococcus sp. YIM 134068]|uniref:WD40 repeat domain-containing protein n=1 Tax=Deinococcus lichenicola TaxID=3118910 RepID=UPI002F92CE5C
MDRQRAVAVDYDGAAAVLVPRQSSPRAVKFRGNSKLRSPIVTPEGRILAVQLDFDRCQVVVWDVTAGRKVTALEGALTRVLACGQDTEFIFDISFTPDGRFLLSADQTGLRRWDARTGRLLENVSGKFLSLNVSPDGRSVVTVGEGRRVEIWTADLARRFKSLPTQPVDCLRGSGGPWPGELSWSADSTKLAYSCEREVRVWNVAAGGLRILKREGKRDAPDAPTFSPDGRFVVAGEYQSGVAIWQTGNGQRVAQIDMPAPEVQVTDVTVGPGNTLFVACSDGRVTLHDLERRGNLLTTYEPFTKTRPNAWLSLAVSRDWGWLAVASADGRLNVYALPGN